MAPRAPSNLQLQTAAGSARLFFLLATIAGVILLSTHVFERVELQSINSRFEARRWVNWAPSSLEKLNPAVLWAYHEKHEIPRQWWHWEYTLSWLIADNHPQSQYKFVLFNHQIEDEPPAEALADHPWMKPLMSYPLPRKTVADCLQFLARSGARLIIVDNDFPQFSNEDDALATAILKCRNGSFAGHSVPVLLSRTINRHSMGNILQLELPTTPSGVLEAISRQDPNVNALDEFTGSSGVVLDEDQVVRRLILLIRRSET